LERGTEAPTEADDGGVDGTAHTRTGPRWLLWTEAARWTEVWVRKRVMEVKRTETGKVGDDWRVQAGRSEG